MTLLVRELSGLAFPPRLRELQPKNDTVWVVGELPRGLGVAIVGTREPTAEGAEFARGLARDLARTGVTVLSGGALGIDTAAHEGALEGGGATVVVAPSSWDCPYPRRNRGLFERVVRAGGGFVTACPAGTQARWSSFFARNAQLAALASVLVVVETRLKGGARNAAAAARRLGRPVMAVPGAPWVPQAQGCLLELRLGATLATSADDVLAALGLPASRKGRAPPDSLTPVPGSVPSGGRLLTRSRAGRPDSTNEPGREAVLLLLRKGPAHPDALCAGTGLAPAQVQAWLLTLTLEGILVCEPSGRVSLVNR